VRVGSMVHNGGCGYEKFLIDSNMNARIIKHLYLLVNPYTPRTISRSSDRVSRSSDRVNNNIRRWVNNILQEWNPI